MATFRCPIHDNIFESITDHRAPGSRGNQQLPDHPVNGHPDCPFCIEAKKKPAQATSTRIA